MYIYKYICLTSLCFVLVLQHGPINIHRKQPQLLGYHSDCPSLAVSSDKMKHKIKIFDAEIYSRKYTNQNNQMSF